MVRFSDRFHMQPFRLLGLCLAFCAMLWTCVPLASADDEDLIQDTSSTQTSEETAQISEYSNDSSSEKDTSVNVYLDPAGGQYRLTDVQTSITRVSASDSNGFKAIILNLIGDYEMVTKEYTYTSTNGYTSKQVSTESDYSWMFSAGIFIIVVYCFLRILGGVICGRK